MVFTWAGLYGAERFVLEFFRGDVRGGLAGLSTSQWLSAVMVLAAAGWALRRLRPDAASRA